MIVSIFVFCVLNAEFLSIYGNNGRPRLEHTLRGKDLGNVMEQVADPYCHADAKVRANLINPDLTVTQLMTLVNKHQKKFNPHHNKPISRTAGYRRSS